MKNTQYHIELAEDAYRKMAALGYRPMAPSDGMGGITRPLAELDLDDEARRFARALAKEEHAGTYWAGTSDGCTFGLLGMAVEILRLMNAGMGGRPWALKVAKLLVEELEPIVEAEADRVREYEL